MAHARLDAPDERYRLDAMAQGVLGLPAARPEGVLKVTGAATYAAESHPADLAFGVLVRAPVASGKLRGLGSVSQLPGVLTVIGPEDLPRNPAQGMASKAPIRGGDTIAYIGQPLALVVAETFEQARHAALNLTAEIEAESAVVDPDEPGAKTETPKSSQSSQGDPNRALADAAFAVDVTYHTAGHSSAPMEPHAATAHWTGDALELRGACQMLRYNRAELADALGIPVKQVRILAPFVGGGFGSKLGIGPEAVGAALAARALGRPVRVVLSRQQVFEATMRRSETRQRFRLGADADGRLTALVHDSRVSQLPGESFSEPVAQATHFLYAGANRRITHEVARVHRTCAGSVRAPGEAVGVVALEAAMDELAATAGLDPLDLRLRNIPERHPETDVPFSSNLLAQALTRGAELFDWRARYRAMPRQRREGEWLIGLGLASAARVNMTVPAEARVTLGPDGLVIETDMTDIGTGTYAILGQIAGEMLGQPLDRVTTRLGDTDFPPGAGSGGSFGACSTGGAVFLACEELRARIAAELDCAEEDLTLRDGEAIAGNRRVPLDQLIGADAWTATGKIEPGKAEKAVRQATFGAHFAEVAVSAVTGETRLRRMLGVFAAGRIFNPATARSQCIGGMTFGIGMALCEELTHDPRDGHLVTRDLANYHLAAHADVPRLEVELLPERDSWTGPLQAKGIGELSICGAAAAITNAIHNACGARVRDLPATPDRVLAAMERAGF